MLLSCRSLATWVRRLVACMGGCFSCCVKPTPITAVDEPSKRLRIQGRLVRKASLSEDFWSTSAHEMENSGIQSQRSMSSISTVAQSSDPHAAGSSSNPNDFVLYSGTRPDNSGLETRNATPGLNSSENQN
ncbi:hypothetical protein C2845_PM10G15710 [Panicum miliaceum]|uniref:Uncharacterized protein n=1 Tax=Panicum miliaceum TaxID=4540 RepID=A0A3L6PAL7_PANMI|nr:hypothetical protein C2845_PM10G15710 [Panicum miliaceum]